jgi:hypothetical protein
MLYLLNAQSIPEEDSRPEEENNKLLHFDVDLDHLTRVVFFRFLPCKVVPFIFLLFILSFLKGSHYSQPTLKNWRVELHFPAGGGVLD